MSENHYVYVIVPSIKYKWIRKLSKKRGIDTDLLHNKKSRSAHAFLDFLDLIR